METQQHRLALPIGYLLGRYRLEGVLGSGGFGITYLAQDVSLSRKVAIKELLPNAFATRLDGTTVVAKTEGDNADLEWARKRFLEEGRVLAACSHPNVVEVYDLIEANSTAYMVTKYEEGQDLERWLRKLGRQPTESELREILLALLSGLEQVHERGFLHRDIKPENIYLTLNGRPVLLDFGSARQAVSGRSQILTAVITPGYAPFEQYHEGGSQGPWSDIYGLGAVIYRAITGTKPPDAAARMMGNDPYQSMVGAHIVGYDVEFLRTIDRALELKQPDRPQDVREWRAMLNASFSSEGPGARRARDRAESESERLDAEPGGKWGVESERTLREKQMRPVHGPESQSAGSVGPSTFLGKKKPYPATGLVTLMVLVVCLGIGAAIYFASQRSKPKDIAPQVKAQPSVSANTPVAGIPPSSTPSVARWLAEAQHYLDAKDYDKALPLLQKAADAGDPAAIFNLGLLYKNGQGVPQDYSKARPFFQKAAEAGNAAAMYNLGRLYMYGLGIDKDYTKAYEWYQKGAAAGDSYAINGLGVLFRYGDGVSQDYGKARELFQKAVDAGNPLGMLNLGLLYESGAGVVQDYGKASALYQKAVDAGNSEGMNYLGWLYQHGRGVVQDYDKARQLYEKSADAGNSQAMARLGWMYEQGKGVAQDYGKARELCEKSADAGNSEGMNYLGLLYENGRGVIQDYSKASALYQKAADAGDSDAMNYLGLLYQNGKGVVQDYSKALELYQKASNAGNLQAMARLGWIYEQGNGVVQDYGKARELYQKAADAGNSEAMLDLGLLHASGHGVDQDYLKAFEWFQKAADAGDSIGMNNLGWLYLNGRGVAQDYGKAHQWFQKAADAGNTDAINNLGDLYDFGRGVTKDYAEARQWYEKAAAAGSVEAMNSLGVMYVKGEGIAQDYAKAREWYQKAADGGNAVAMCNLGVMYRKGEGGVQDDAKAREWIQKAADAGNENAKKMLKELPNVDRSKSQAATPQISRTPSRPAASHSNKSLRASSPASPSNSLYEMGVIAENNQDYAGALRFYQMAAAMGDADARRAVARVRFKLGR